jgi:hypothetical protein
MAQQAFIAENSHFTQPVPDRSRPAAVRCRFAKAAKFFALM